jgi:hypothetical protein
LPEIVNLDQLVGGRSKSVVFSAKSPANEWHRRFVPYIVKFSRLSEYFQERQRYDKFVKWSLPYAARVDLLASAEGRDWGAIAYSFAHGAETTETLTGLLRGKRLDAVQSAIRTLFDHAKEFWSPLSVYGKPEGLRDHYFQRYFDRNNTWFDDNQRLLHGAASEAGLDIGETKRHFNIGQKQYPNPLSVLTKYESRQASQSLCHGDLNTNNIIVAGDRIALIDFRDFGVGHVFEDMVTLEGCIRQFSEDEKLSGTPVEMLEKTITSERARNSSDLSAPEAGEEALISEIRRGAFALFPEEDRRNYFFSLAYYCFRLLRIQPLTPMATVRLLACLLASSEKVLAPRQ